MNYGIFLVSIIGFLALAGMGCILIDCFLTKNNQSLTKLYKQHSSITNNAKIVSNNFLQDLEEYSVILDDEKK